MSQERTQNIALIGFMAVGKSAVGRTLARKLKRRFVDLDKVIEKAEGIKVRDIFEQKGEVYFRQREKEALAQILERHGQIIATGGGVVLDQENVKLLRDKALLICLAASTDVLLKRAGHGGKRPLLKGSNRKERIEEILRQRANHYAQAHACVETSDLSVDEVVQQIVTLLNLES
ncbi:MAG TPA: shikimate kinase [Candidatus Binatia bacterium]